MGDRREQMTIVGPDFRLALCSGTIVRTMGTAVLVTGILMRLRLNLEGWACI